MKTIILFLLLVSISFAQKSAVFQLIMNSGTEAVVPEVPSVTDSLFEYWIDDMSNGDVATWVGKVKAITLNERGVGTMTKSADGITTNGTSSLFMSADSLITFPLFLDGTPITVEAVVKIVDTATVDFQVVAGVRDPANTNYLTLAVRPSGQLAIRSKGAGEYNIHGAHVFNQMVHIVAVSNGVDANSLYVNGVLIPSIGTDGSVSAGGIEVLGGNGANYTSNGTIIRLVKVHRGLAFDQTKVDTDYAWVQSLGLLP